MLRKYLNTNEAEFVFCLHMMKTVGESLDIRNRYTILPTAGDT